MTALTPLERLERLEDARAIEALKYRYAEICDTGYSSAGFREIFVPGGRWSANGFGSYTGHDAICGFFENLAATVIQAQHYVTSPRIIVSDDGLSATGQFYLLCLSRSRSRRDPALVDLVLTTGTYDDCFRKQAGRWLFEELTVAVRHVSRLSSDRAPSRAIPEDTDGRQVAGFRE